MAPDDSEPLSADDAHILGVESASITGHTLKLVVLAAHHALRISAISCAGDMGIGLCTDPNALSDIAGLADCVDAAYQELRVAAGI